MPSRASVLCLSLALAACGGSQATVASKPRLRERLTPCSLPGITEPLLCGTYAVWENRATQRGRKIGLHIVVVPATTPTPAPDPIFAFAGGPGDFASNAAGEWAGSQAIRAQRDIVLIDQRGTGGSNPLRCTLPHDPADVQAYFEPPLPVAEVKRCRAELAQRADLTQYTTSIAADDVDEVRAWLGYDRINLDGGSYGTRAAQVYLRRHPGHVRSATLVGVAAMDQYLPLFHARDGKRALDLLFQACADDPACAAAFPHLDSEHDRVLIGLDHERGHATVESPVDHHPVAVTIPRDIFAEQIRFTLYNAATAAAVPYVLHRAAQGDFEPFAHLAMLWEPGFRSAIAWGMNLSVTCAEDIPFVTPAAIDAAIAGTYLGGYRVLQQVAACREWPRGAIPADFHQPVASDVPVLLVSGLFDPVTPPRFAAQVLTHFPHRTHLVLRDGHHGGGGLSHPECLTQLLTTFVERGTSEGLDTSCLDGMTRPAFITDAAGFDALLVR